MSQLPKNFLLHAQKFAGNEYDAFIESLSQNPSVSIRINPFKREGTYATEKIIPWSKEGRYLKERPSFTFDPLFHAGCYYVQDASSQFLEQAFKQAKKNLKRPIRILDLCAAPGGKSTHILSMIDDTDLLVCNEIISSRNNILRQNIMKWGKENVIVTQNDPADFSRLIGFFDIVIVDAPCSGEGLFRKDENAKNEWSEENIQRCSVRQHEILKHAYASLCPGGFLIYSTCTFEEDENDSPVQSLFEKFDMKIQTIESNFPGILKTKNGLVFFPHRIRGEGFYISLLQKKDGDQIPVKKVSDKIDTPFKKHLVRYLKNEELFSALLKDDRLFAIPNAHLNSLNTLNRNLYVRLAGIYLGDFKGDDFIPSSAIALSLQLKEDQPSKELTEMEAIEYLKGGNLQLEIPKGWSLVNYKSFQLGWIKNIGTRINNYYPKEWRIKKQHPIQD